VAQAEALVVVYAGLLLARGEVVGEEVVAAHAAVELAGDCNGFFVVIIVIVIVTDFFVFVTVYCVFVVTATATTAIIL
jgi:hypothetical protein